MNLWTHREADTRAVENPVSSPVGPHSANPLLEREEGVIPVLHTLYDYDKGIS